jgi:hypothetical protein
MPPSGGIAALEGNFRAAGVAPLSVALPAIGWKKR